MFSAEKWAFVAFISREALFTTFHVSLAMCLGLLVVTVSKILESAVPVIVREAETPCLFLYLFPASKEDQSLPFLSSFNIFFYFYSVFMNQQRLSRNFRFLRRLLI